MRWFVARFNFSCNLIGNRPQSLSGPIAIGWCNVKENQLMV